MADAEPNAQYRQLVEQLHEPWTRRAARQRLVAARAAEPLLECLKSTNESVVWAAIQSLGEMRAAEAVEPLVALLERGTLTLDVAESLRLITGQDFGIDVKRWRAWAQRSDAGGPPVGSQPVLDPGDCIRRTAKYLGVEPSGSGTSYQFKVALQEGRFQKVDVYFRGDDAQPDPLVVIYSPCGPAVPKLYETVLRKNLAIPCGAFAIRDVDGQPHFVMVHTVLAASVTPSVLARHIENIAARADAVEKSLTKDDRR